MPCALVAVVGLILGGLVAVAAPAAAQTASTLQAQWDLAGLGYLPYSGVDGKLGPQTENSTRAFQSDACLSVDGIVGPNTTAALMAKVKQVQRVAGTTQDGEFGPHSEQAVKNWQSKHGLTADGQAGPLTMAKMGIARSTCTPPTQGQPVPPTTNATAQAQWDLAGLGYLTFSDIDGIAGPQTAAAAESFQEDACIGVDGIIGPITTGALETEVRKVQKVAGTTQDGGYGPITEQAVKNWQRAHKVSPVDGQAGPVTMAAMRITRRAKCSSPPPPPPDGNLGKAIASIAASELDNRSRNHEIGGYNCNYYTTAFGRGTTGCSNGWRSEEWCADFANWVWRQADAKIDGLDAAAGSFYTYGRSKGTWHTSNPHVGDAVVFNLSGTSASHVGLVTAVSGGSFTMISGNSYDPSDGQDDAITRVTLADSGGGISGFADPVSNVPPPAHSTNFDWAKVVLADGGWPQSSNNVTVLTQWMDSEEPASDWWDRNNPLNNGLGSGGGAGLGSYSDLLTAAHYVAANLQGGASDYGQIVRDLAASAAPATTAAAIWDSPWAGSHYGYGQSWHSGSVPSVAAPARDW